jgi:hypothetical protein
VADAQGMVRFVNIVTVRYITAAVLLGRAIHTSWTALR